MLKHLAAASMIALCCSVAAFADTNTHVAANAPAARTAQADLPPVDGMTCDQMQAEMTADGQVMSHQLDPQFGADAQAQYNEAIQKQREINQQAPRQCAGLHDPVFCARPHNISSNSRRKRTWPRTKRAQTQMNRLNGSMTGLDLARMQAMNNRWQAQHGQASQR